MFYFTSRQFLIFNTLLKTLKYFENVNSNDEIGKID